ncbi:MAG: hypothetical protein IV086_00535 [Hyphomonadaceae bacterium]|nr:MAG: hypothetical protein FD160_1366 [Caulobacteraceae bacterium]MBT9444163.1 hypothetical protein [Hyphomonadaceae bacterium]TPW04907.1 MAG: hypothetical protein FD124_2420 [Alphaproteobacteria bacterium]
MFSPRIVIFAAAAVSCAALAAPAFAGDNEDRSAGMQACKAAIAQQLQIDVSGVRLDKIQTRGRVIKMRFDARKDGQRISFADCVYTRRTGEVNVVVATPPAAVATTN